MDGEIFELSTEEEPSEPVPCTGITLDKTELALSDTETAVTLVATVTPFDTTDQIVWSVNKTGVVTVENGVVKGIANGSCVVTAKCGAYSATCAVTVNIIVSYTKANLDGYWDFVDVEDGYSGIITNKAVSGTLQGETYLYTQNAQTYESYGGIENGEMLTGVTDKYGAVSYCDCFRIKNPETGMFYAAYPYTVEIYGAFTGYWNNNGVRGTTNNYGKQDGKGSVIMSTRCVELKSGAAFLDKSGTILYYNDESTLKAAGAIGMGNNTFTLESAVDATAYHHYVVVVDKSLVRVYLDGAMVGEGTASNNTITNTGVLYVLGCGNLRMCRVYNAILTDEQVANNYTNTIAVYGGEA